MEETLNQNSAMEDLLAFLQDDALAGEQLLGEGGGGVRDFLLVHGEAALLDKIGGSRLMRLKNEPHLGYSTTH